MSGTGRLVGTIGPRTRRVVYGELSHAELEAELPLMVRVDRAHLVMLAARNLVSADAAARLLRCIDELAADRFRPLLDRPAPRGLYLMYEGYLIERLGPDIGGVLHSGRSRNDLKATITTLRFREWVLEFAEQATRLEAVLLSRARAHRSVVMPIHTHFQAAMPITYGHYLLGVALAVGRDLDAVLAAAAGFDACPLGAGAVAGTDLPIDPAHTARLLGFTSSTRHAVDAVASRDAPLRLLGAAAGLAVTLSRLATDLQLWSTVEFGFVHFPDRLVGGSSAMPQKRNAFLLEHVKAKPGQAVGAWAAAAATMSSTPFTNSIEVGTEAVADVWHGLAAVGDSVLLSQVLVSGARPVPERMAERAEAGFTTATSIANRLVRAGVPFRTAHHTVGEAVRRAVEAGSTRLADFGPPGWLDDTGLAGVDLATLMREHVHGGGPGDFDGPHEEAVAGWAAHRQWHLDRRHALAAADAHLGREWRLVSEHQTPLTMVLVESNTTGSGRLFCAAARDLGLRPVLLARDPGRYPYVAADGVDSVVVDTDDVRAVLAACAALPCEVVGVTSSSEYFVGTASEVARELGLPHQDPDAVRACRDKHTQRSRLRDAGVPGPGYDAAATPDAAVAAASAMTLPVVVKPASGSGSIATRLCATLDEVRAAASTALRLPGQPVVVIEEYLDGPEFSVETLDGQVVGITAKHLGPHPHFVEIGHDFPAPLPPDLTAALGTAALEALAALGLGWGAAHVELRLTADGPRIVEVNPRLAGGMIPRLVDEALGVDLIAHLVASTVGRPRPLRPTRDAAASIRFLVAAADGRLVRITGADEARRLPGVVDVVLTRAPGQEIVLRHSFQDRLGFVIAAAADGGLATKVADEALLAIGVRIAPADDATEDL